MRHWPMLDLKDAWQDAHRSLVHLEELTAEIYGVSENTWHEMQVLLQYVRTLRESMQALPSGIVQQITSEERDYAELEAQADA